MARHDTILTVLHAALGALSSVGGIMVLLIGGSSCGLESQAPTGSDRRRVPLESAPDRAVDAADSDAVQMPTDPRLPPLELPFPPVDEPAPPPQWTKFSGRFSFAGPTPPGDWPRSEGIRWQSDYDEALAEARRREVPVLVYVGTAGCAACKTLDRTLWPKPAVIQKSREVVMYGGWRFGGGEPSDVAVSLGVGAYPKISLVDGYGEPLSASFSVVSAGGFNEAIDTALASYDPEPPARRELPKALREHLSAGVAKALESATRRERAALWLDHLHTEQVSTGFLAALFEWEREPTVRVAVLDVVEAGWPPQGASLHPSLQWVMFAAATDPNFFVRVHGLSLLGRHGDPRVLPAVHTLLSSRRSGGNITNVNHTLLETVGDIADPSSLPTLIHFQKTSFHVDASTTLPLLEAAVAIERKTEDPRARQLVLAIARALAAADDSQIDRIARSVNVALSMLSPEDAIENPRRTDAGVLHARLVQVVEAGIGG